ncbi:MAG: KTSC domain-containing protein [Lutibacter sp.]|nr:KTSC domain-containing protein [Lutibacter sp.]
MSVRFFDVTSSNIKQIGYDQKKMVLVIRFKKGGEYHYSNFLESDWALFCSCESVGKHFHSHINKNFEFSKAE